jgi:hypothetical protein
MGLSSVWNLCLGRTTRPCPPSVHLFPFAHRHLLSLCSRSPWPRAATQPLVACLGMLPRACQGDHRQREEGRKVHTTGMPSAPIERCRTSGCDPAWTPDRLAVRGGPAPGAAAIAPRNTNALGALHALRRGSEGARARPDCGCHSQSRVLRL